MQANRVASSKTPGVGHNWDSVCNFLADVYCFKSLTRQNGGAGLAGGLIYYPQAGPRIARRHVRYFSLLVQVLQYHDMRYQERCTQPPVAARSDQSDRDHAAATVLSTLRTQADQSRLDVAGSFRRQGSYTSWNRRRLRLHSKNHRPAMHKHDAMPQGRAKCRWFASLRLPG